jgi:histidine triad (HIT) family protein
MTIFEKIVAGEVPAYKVLEDDNHLAFLDVFPLKKGHVLVIPKKCTDYIFDLPDEDLASLHLFAKKVAVAIKKAFPCSKVGMAVVGLEVPHTHIHLIPINSVSEMDFSQEKLKLSQEDFIEVKDKISKHL